MSSNVIFNNVTKKYSDAETEAVKPLNVEIKDKEFMILVGPSGCGKSTTLRMIAGLESITSGEIIINDRPVNNIEPKDRNIAMVFQDYALYPHMTVKENIAFPLVENGVNKKEAYQKVAEVVEVVQLTEYLDRRPSELSGGQRQRVALGRAMVRNPEVFLLDEPLSNLDAKLRIELRSEIVQLHRKLDTTFVYVTHDQDEAMTMGDRIMVLNGGVLEQVDTPINLFNNPASKFVGEFIGSPKMNVFPTTLTKKDGEILFTMNSQEFPVGERVMKRFKVIPGEAYVGIRPEKFKLVDQPSDMTIEIEVINYELLGYSQHVYFNIPEREERLQATISTDTPLDLGDKLYLKIDTDDLYFFDKETESTLLERSENNE